MIFLPILSTNNPNNGDAPADIRKIRLKTQHSSLAMERVTLDVF